MNTDIPSTYPVKSISRIGLPAAYQIPINNTTIDSNTYSGSLNNTIATTIYSGPAKQYKYLSNHTRPQMIQDIHQLHISSRIPRMILPAQSLLKILLPCTEPSKDSTSTGPLLQVGQLS